MNAIPEPPNNTTPDDNTFEITPTVKRLLVLNLLLIMLIIAGLVAVFVGLGRGFWLQIGQVLF